MKKTTKIFRVKKGLSKMSTDKQEITSFYTDKQTITPSGPLDSLFQQVFSVSPKDTKQAITINPFGDKEMSAIIFEVLTLVDLFLSNRTKDPNTTQPTQDWQLAVQAFKDKWLKSEAPERIMYVIDQSIEDLREGLMATFGLDPRYDNFIGNTYSPRNLEQQQQQQKEEGDLS